MTVYQYDGISGYDIMEFKSELDCCKAALAVQDACNPMGVMCKYREIVIYLCHHGYGFSGKNLGDHPAIILFQDKVNDLMHVRLSERTQRYPEAYEACKRIIANSEPRTAVEV
jgi:hypothetical protein